MGMGVVSSEDFERELKINGTPNGVNKSKVEILTPTSAGRTRGDNNVPESLRKIIGEESIINGRQEALALANMFGISPSSVSAYAKGATSTDSYNKPNDKLLGYLNNRKARITKKALRTLQSAMEEITPEKLAGVKAKDCAAIAKDMSAIVKNFEPEKSPLGNFGEQNNQFIFYAPTFMKEQEYEIIQVQE